MIVRIFLIVLIVGLIILYMGGKQSNNLFMLVGISAVLAGIVGMYAGWRNKKTSKWMRRLGL